MQATDHAVITSTPVAASLAGSFGVGAVSLALGEAVAMNGIHNTVSAVVDGSTVLASSSAVKVGASEESSITATPTAVSASISVGAVSVALGGAVTVAKNTISNVVDAAVVNGSSRHRRRGRDQQRRLGEDQDDVDGGHALRGGRRRLGLARGRRRARHELRHRQRHGARRQLHRLVDEREGRDDVHRHDRRDRDGVSVAISAGLGAGTIASRRRRDHEQRGHDGRLDRPREPGAKGVVASTGDVEITARDTSTITSTPTVASVAVSIGAGSFAVAVGVAIAVNNVGNSVTAKVDGSRVAAPLGAVKVTADEKATITAKPTAVSVSLGVG